MEDVKVCRLCLNMDVKMHNLQLYPLESYFASIMNIIIDSKPLYSTNLPPYACYECAALVKKFSIFRQKCAQSQAELCRVIDELGQLTPSAIKSIDRHNLLMITQLLHINIQGEEVILEKPEFAVEVIKKEDHKYDDITDTIPDHDDFSDDEECNQQDKNKISKADLEKVDITVKLNIGKDIKGLELSQAKTDVSPPKSTPIAKPKKQGRLKKVSKSITKRKSQEDCQSSDDKTDMDDITVITLSVEEQIEEINKRKESSNYLNCPYQCHLCYKGFNNTQAWNHHVTKHSPTAGDIECNLCKYRFKTKRTLQRHLLNHGKKYVCNVCSYKSSNITTVRQHQGSHRGVTHKCNFCDEVFNVRTTYVSHMRIKHPSENICGFCGYSFHSKQGLVVHKNMVHRDLVGKAEDKEGQYCAECDVKFISSEAFKRHMVMSVKHTRTTDSINGCRDCGATFEDPEELRLHHREEHPKKQPKHHRKKRATSNNINKWPAKCEQCSVEIPSGRAYWKHFRLMHPNENYPIEKKCVCDICGKRFVCNAILIMHKRTHFDERPYKCSQCDKACFTAFDLRVHQQKHSDMRPFPCTVCPKAFKRKEALERHLKIHSGDNPYKCEICGVAFNKSCTRTLHVRTVHTKEPAPHRKRRNK